MRNKNIKPTIKIKLPELQINGECGKVIKWISHIRHIYRLIIIVAFLGLFVVLMPHNKCSDFWVSLKSQKILISMVLFFSLVVLSLVWSIGQCIDSWIFMYFNVSGRRPPWLDWVMLGITQLGNGVFAMVVALILFLRSESLPAYELAFGTLTLWLIVEVIKVIIRRTRPYMKLKNIRIVGSLASGHSFPSGHTSQVFFMTTLFMHYYSVNVWIWGGLYVVSLLVGITRIYVGMHYPRDVLGGALLGTAWGLLGVFTNNCI